MEIKGQAKWSEIHKFMMEQKLGKKLTSEELQEYRGHYSSYFSGSSFWQHDDNNRTLSGRTSYSHGLLMRPTKQDTRYLVKDGGYYRVKYFTQKS